MERLALSNKTGTPFLYNPSERHGGTGSLVSPRGKGGQQVSVKRFDEYWINAGLTRVRLVKIDVEGAEMKVLQGMRDLLKRKAFDYLIIEIDDVRGREAGYSAKDVLDFLRCHGYTLFHIKLFRLTPIRDNEEIRFANVLAEAIR